MLTAKLARLALTLLPLTLAAQAPDPVKMPDGKVKTEFAMSPGIRIKATSSVGEIAITAVDELTRSYTWEGASRSVEMSPRHERWYGSLGLYFPGPDEHWKPHNGISRAVTEEGQRHFKSAEEATDWIKSRKWMPYVYRDDGLVVGWKKTLPRRQLEVEVWQILIDGKKPERLVGSENEKIVVSTIETSSTALEKAVRNNEVETVKQLLAKGADPNSADIVGRPVLTLAAKRGRHEIVRALLEKGARANARTENGSTALLEATGGEHVEVVKALVQLGADPNMATDRGFSGWTPLMSAAMGDNPEIVKTLLEHGADVNKSTGFARLTALKIAQDRKQPVPEIIRLLKEAGAKE